MNVQILINMKSFKGYFVEFHGNLRYHSEGKHPLADCIQSVVGEDSGKWVHRLRCKHHYNTTYPGEKGRLPLIFNIDGVS